MLRIGFQRVKQPFQSKYPCRSLPPTLNNVSSVIQERQHTDNFGLFFWKILRTLVCIWSVFEDKVVCICSVIQTFFSTDLLCHHCMTPTLPNFPHSAWGLRILLWPPALLHIGNFLSHGQLSYAWLPHWKLPKYFMDVNRFRYDRFGGGKIKNFLLQSRTAWIVTNLKMCLYYAQSHCFFINILFSYFDVVPNLSERKSIYQYDTIEKVQGS